MSRCLHTEMLNQKMINLSLWQARPGEQHFIAEMSVPVSTNAG